MLLEILAFSLFTSLTDWQAAVGPSVLEDFDRPDEVVPAEGGTIAFNGFVLSADGRHDAAPGVLNHRFIGDTIHDGGPSGPSFNLFLFDAPVSALAFDLLQVEDAVFFLTWETDQFHFDESGDPYFVAPGFLGFVFDGPAQNFEISASGTYVLDDLRFTPVPEPSSFLLTCLGLALLARTPRR